MQQERFDAIIIGSGQAGNPLAKAFAKHGMKTAIIERWNVGGTCVNIGCTPTKTMVASARVAYLARRSADFGVHTGSTTVNMQEVFERKQKIVDTSRASNEKGLEDKNITLIRGEASFSEKQPSGEDHAISIKLTDGAQCDLISTRIILNTGERPVVPQLDGLDTVPFLDSTSIQNLTELPEHLIVLGGGTIALEFGQMFRRFGSRVTILERSHRFLPHEDEDIAECMLGILREDGIEVLLDTTADKVTGNSGNITITTTTGGKQTDLKGSYLLVATGRTPNVEALNLKNASVAQLEHGYVKVNDRLETSTPGIWALGDVKGGPAFTHVSYDDYRILSANLLEDKQSSIKDRILTYVMFTDPELGRVGLNEDQAKQQGKKVRVAAVPMSYMARAKEMGETRGMIKALVDPDTDLILGATVLGIDAGEVAAQIQLAIMGKLPYTTLRDAMLSHPTRAEVLNTLFGYFRDEQ